MKVDLSNNACVAFKGPFGLNLLLLKLKIENWKLKIENTVAK